MFKGSMVAIVTPMRANGALDYDALEKLVEWHIAEGTDALVAAGTTGESPTLESKEHAVYLREVIRRVAGRIPVICGTGSNSTAQTLALTREAAELGADACLLVVPYYNKPSQEGLYQHFRTIAEAVDVPQILYNVPGRTVADLLPETVGRLSKIKNIVAIKDASGDVSRVAKHRELCGGDFDLYSGDDATAREFLLAGGHGVITVTGNVAPRAMHELCVAACAGDAQGAEAIDQTIAGLHKSLFVEANPIPVKWALNRMGKIEAGIRLPLVPLSEEFQPEVKQALLQAGIHIQ
ncbi:MAG TPA: 4-hydroxy-tetrahydrodipicolinate synthase [Gammaproteobacteria bacterium]|nr:4-hydroxy-tetrahydrodipicolinate synthase [Gammaproteobacteria bacterium]